MVARLPGARESARVASLLLMERTNLCCDGGSFAFVGVWLARAGYRESSESSYHPRILPHSLLRGSSKRTWHHAKTGQRNIETSLAQCSEVRNDNGRGLLPGER